MSMTTPPGWYPDPAVPTVERWWDGTAWTGHTRPADGGRPTAVVVPPKPRTGRVLQIAAAALAVAAVVTTVVLLRPGGDGTPVAKQPAASPASAPASPSPSEEPQDPQPSATAEDDSVLVDQLNGITLPVPQGWEKPDTGIDRSPGMAMTDDYKCPNTTRYCKRGRVLSRTLTSSATTPEAMAKEDISEAAEQLYGEDGLGNRPYGGISSHKVVAARQAVVAGRTGYLVRWQVTTGKGPGGYVQSLVFPSPNGVEHPVVVRFAFDAGQEAPPLTLMDEITKGIRPIGSSTSGGVGSSLAPGNG
ncbi:DUF2510 domain-containing protein [Streptomyces sp. TRM49041]|uniref:DUF2510 domain-containing protein n=1 Tax=Streptomyces sp. TRM49041 TaxID=2603216 RepID=UPI0011EFD415|nr:DUF2510 domain-containing protein [Streptomyces sp. TRM49041]